MSETGIDWLRDDGFLRACTELELGGGSYNNIAEAAIRCYLNRNPPLTPSLTVEDVIQPGLLKKSFSDWIREESGGMNDGLPTDRVFIADVRSWIDTLRAPVQERKRLTPERVDELERLATFDTTENRFERGRNEGVAILARLIKQELEGTK